MSFETQIIDHVPSQAELEAQKHDTVDTLNKSQMDMLMRGMGIEPPVPVEASNVPRVPLAPERAVTQTQYEASVGEQFTSRAELDQIIAQQGLADIQYSQQPPAQAA